MGEPVQTAEAGWYPNPSGSGGLRYWSGSEWTDHVESGGSERTADGWQAGDGKWFPQSVGRSSGWWLASDGGWYPPEAESGSSSPGASTHHANPPTARREWVVLALGIVSIFTYFTVVVPLSAILLAGRTMRQQRRAGHSHSGRVIAGLLLGSFSLLIGVFFWIFALAYQSCIDGGGTPASCV